ncbi:MAG: ABC transporter ATP-binding protein [Spirulinaceae cyanobacterium]
MKNVIALTHVNKVFDKGTIALEDFNLQVAEAEFVSLVGPSGCGKSTVLRIIAGLSSLSSGNIQWHDSSLEKDIAFVFQEPALMPWANVKDNIYLPLKLAGISPRKAETTITEALELVKLARVADSYPRQLSGGMKMRVSIARALVTNPQVLLMDEPFGALDDITRNQLNNDLLALWKQKHWTVVFVTHNIYEAVYLSHRVVVMGANPGRVVAEVPIAQPYPRTEKFRSSPLYSKYYRQVAEQLSQAMTR